MPARVQRRRAKGWRMPAGAVYVGRGSKWGNPFVVGVDGTRDECLKLYVGLAAGFLCASKRRKHVEAQERVHAAMREASKELAGKDLVCWCPVDKPCHGDVLLALANGTKIPAAWCPRFQRIS